MARAVAERITSSNSCTGGFGAFTAGQSRDQSGSDAERTHVKVGIIGGGIAGLSAARTLEKARRQGTEVEYRLFERSARLGGTVRTEGLPDAAMLAAGPASF